MGIFSREIPEEELEEKLDRLRIQGEVENERSNIVEQRILQRQLRRKYGKNWKNILGNMRNNESMRTLAEAGAGYDLRNSRFDNSSAYNLREMLSPGDQRDGMQRETPDHGIPGRRRANDNILPSSDARFKLV